MGRRIRNCILAIATTIATAIGPTSFAAQADAAKARALVDAAIKMTDSNEAVKLLWQATDIDPSLQEAYVYLSLYYQSRSDFDDMVKVYQKLLRYQPNQTSAYLNIAEAYMSYDPPRTNDAMVYYRKALSMDSHNAFAELRIGQTLYQTGNRDEAAKYLRMALTDGAHNQSVVEQAQRTLKVMGAL